MKGVVPECQEAREPLIREALFVMMQLFLELQE